MNPGHWETFVVTGSSINEEQTLIIAVYGDAAVYGLGCGREQCVHVWFVTHTSG